MISQLVEAQKTSHAFEIRLWYFHIAMGYFLDGSNLLLPYLGEIHKPAILGYRLGFET